MGKHKGREKGKRQLYEERLIDAAYLLDALLYRYGSYQAGLGEYIEQQYDVAYLDVQDLLEDWNLSRHLGVTLEDIVS